MLVLHGEGGRRRGAEMRAQGLRAGAALALRSLIAKEETVITDAWQVTRGYINSHPEAARFGGTGGMDRLTMKDIATLTSLCPSSTAEAAPWFAARNLKPMVENLCN